MKGERIYKNCAISSFKASTMERDSEEVKTERIKQSIKLQLVKFDEYSKKIAIAKEATTLDPGERARLQSEFAETETKISSLEHEISVEERVTSNILSESPGKVKLLQKQHDKVTKLKGSIAENEARIASIMSRIDEVENKEKLARELGTIQATYKQCLTSLMNLRNRFPEIYNEAEQESGIYFLSTPKLGNSNDA
jgi:chromosome segregation ATPase